MLGGAAAGRTSGRKLRIGVIGVANRGKPNLDGVAGEDIVALCDVDARFLAGAGERFPNAARFADYRQLLELDGLDAVVISTPDHHHAPPAEIALRRGLDVYCEKPLTHTVDEARRLTELAKKHGAVTQMGTQIHSLPNYRRVVELVRSGAIGEVAEVHVFVGTNAWGGGDRPEGALPVPDHLDWNLWLGPAPERPYHEGYHPAHWRKFWDFGGGTLADMMCHYADLAFWALELRHPTWVEAASTGAHAETAPKDLTVRYRFDARGDQPAVDLTWYHGADRPERAAEFGLDDWKNGVLFVGEDGRYLISGYTNHQLGPAADFEGFEPPAPTIPDSIGHYAEWIEACKARTETTCQFSYAGPLTEAVLLGNISFRLGGKPLEWDAQSMTVRNAPEASGFLGRSRRDW